MKGKFEGEYEVAIDERNRIMVPYKYRRIMKEKKSAWVLVPVKDEVFSLDVMTKKEYDALKADLKEEAPRGRLNLMAEAQPMSMDHFGRLLLPLEFREYFRNKALVLGAGEYFCIDPISQ